MTTSQAPESGFIGRQPELAVLTAALDDALAGRGQMVMLAGEPGIGKTRLSQELASHAESLGAQVMWGWCYEHVGAPPYWPYVHPIRGYIESADAKLLSIQIGSAGAVIAQIVPELREKLPDVGEIPPAEPEQAQFRLFDSVATFFKNVSQDRPLVFIADDLHWADSSSLLMLEFLAREIASSRVLILGTYRDMEITGNHPLSKTMGNLVRDRHYRRVQLNGLSWEEVGAFVQGSKGVDLAADVLQTIHSRTDGNPLFVNEVVELIDPEQITENRAWSDVIPEGIRDAIGSRLSRLSDGCNTVLSTASVIGREFDFSLLRTLGDDVDADSVLSALDEALQAKVIDEIPDAVGRYQFGHALIQQALYDDMSSIRKLRAHASIAESLEQMHETNLEPYAAELTRHYAEAASLLGSEKLVRYSLMAGEQSLSAYGYDDALTYFQTGLAGRDISLSSTETASDEEAAALLFGLARAQATTFERHQLGEAFGTLRRAFEFYADSGNVALGVAAAIFPVAPAGVLIPGIAQLMARALTLVPPDSHDAGRILSRYGGILGAAEGDYEGAQNALEQAEAIARREGDVLLELQTLTNASDVSGRNLRWKESVDRGERAIGLLTGDENSYYEVLSRYFTSLSMIHIGQPDGVHPHAIALQALVERRVTGVLATLCFGPNIYLSGLQGDWESGRSYSDRSLEMNPTDPLVLLSRIVLEHETGESVSGDAFLDQLLEAMRLSTSGQIRAAGRVSLAITTIARITGAPANLDVAKAAANTILSQQKATPGDAMHAHAGMALLAVLEGDQIAAQQSYDQLLDKRGTMTSSVASVDRILGLLSQTLGNPSQAADHFEDAMALCRKAGYRPELAWTCCDYADTLQSRGAEGDGQKAASLLAESLAITKELGMRPLNERVSARLENVDSRPAGTSAYPDGLTQREVEVLRLICDGRTDREIAEELFISFRTVGNHVRNILGKTDTANRTEAATYAGRHGLVADESAG